MGASPTDRFRRADAIFDAALDRPADERTTFVDRACGDDAELRAAVLSLLRAHDDSADFLESPAVEVAAPILGAGTRAADPVPDRIGAFRVVREIGRGGMGTVFLGERDDGQFEQRVAIKLIQYATPEVVRRFVKERRILALLEHASIARLIDGGITASGLPYLAMELVDGEPIDRYCAARDLTLERRLELFTRACDAVDYAHQRLVVHCDLKPSNILVTADGQVKLLDFGIATLLGALEHGADATRTELIALTPEFAAPEQILGAPVSTATDVYALGVMLYLLLTGERPYRVSGRTPSEIERIVCVDDPPTPSDRAPRPWRGRLRGDLDVIVLKSLRKEPEQRYGSVRELADDVRRHLSGHAVLARPQTTGYRARRFAKRHAWGVAAATTIMLLVSAYAISMAVQRSRVEHALAEATVGAAKAERVTAFMLGLFEASDRGQAFADTLTARDLLNRGIASARELSGQPEIRAQLLDAVGHIHMQLGEFDAARPVFEEALSVRREVLDDEHADIATSLANVAAAARRLGDDAAAIPLQRRALAIRRRVLSDRHPLTLEAVYWHAHGLHQNGESDAAQPFFDEWIAAISSDSVDVTSDRATQLINLGQLLLYRGDHERAERLVRQAVAIRRDMFGERHASVAKALSELAGVHLTANRLQDAEQSEREAVAMLRSLYPDGHPDLTSAIRGHAVALHRLGRWAEAETLYIEQQAAARRFYGEKHVFFGNSLEDLGLLLHSRALYDRAEPYLRRAAHIYRDRLGEASLLTRRVEVLLGDVLRRDGRFTEAEPLLLAGFVTFNERRVPGFDYARRIAIEALAELYTEQGRVEEADKFRALLSGTAASN